MVRCCRVAVESLRSLGADAVVLQESPYPSLPDSLEEVLASRALTCAADGMLYRELLAEQAQDLGLAVHRYPRRSDPVAEASAALDRTEEEIAGLLSRFGREVGPPWRKEHRRAAAAALCVLAGGGRLRTAG